MRVVSTLEDARRALREQGNGGAGAPPAPQIQLCSPPFAACHAGVHYYRHLVDALAAEFPDAEFTFTLCCGDDAAIAHDALRLGFASVICDCGDGPFAQLQALADGLGAVVERTKAYDLSVVLP